ncbi:MAG: glycosyltransferase family 39 protein [Nannocystaceae bacterium]
MHRLRTLTLALSLAWALALAIVIALRITFPLELEWMEGGILHHALRIREGLPIYDAPSIDFVPFLYTPLYPALIAWLSALFPLDFALGRALSVLATIACAAGLWRAAAIEGKPRAHRAAAAGLFLAGYVFTFRWYDVARADMMMMAMVLWGALLLRQSGERPRLAWGAAILLGLAFWTKQTAAVLIFAAGVAALVAAPRALFRPLARTTAWTAAIILLGLYAGAWMTENWLWTYIYKLHQAHAFNAERFTRKTWGMFVHAAPFLVILAGAGLFGDLRGLVARVRKRLSDRTGPWGQVLLDPAEAAIGRRYWGALAAAGLLVSALGYSTQWAEPNAFIPGVCLGAAYLAVALPVGGRAEALGLALVCLQLIFAAVIEPFYQPIQDRGAAGLRESYRLQAPSRTIPSAAARERAAALRSELEAEAQAGDPRPLLALHRPWWSVLAGGPGHVGSMGLQDVSSVDQPRLRAAMRASLRARAYREIRLEGEVPTWMRGALGGHYQGTRRIQGEDRVLPMSGYMSEAGMVTPYRADQLILGPCAPRPAPAGARVLADFEHGLLGGFTFTGAAFHRKNHPAIVGDLPALGPHGGEWLLGSATSRQALSAVGEALSGEFVAARGDRVELLVGAAAGPRDGLELEIVAGEGEAAEVHPLALPDAPAWVLVPLRWQVPAALAGRPLRLRVRDQSPRSAIFIDDLWLVPAGG